MTVHRTTQTHGPNTSGQRLIAPIGIRTPRRFTTATRTLPDNPVLASHQRGPEKASAPKVAVLRHLLNRLAALRPGHAGVQPLLLLRAPFQAAAPWAVSWASSAASASARQAASGDFGSPSSPTPSIQTVCCRPARRSQRYPCGQGYPAYRECRSCESPPPSRRR